MKQIPFLWLLVVMSSLATVTAQSPATLIPLDKNVKVGKLANGLTYYIRKNARPEKKAELRLVVNAGSVLEREDQQGIAHFLEHMAFNGTRNFPKNELLGYLQKAGVRFGADLNATTNFDYTLYMLPIPSDDEKVLNNGYQVIRDWAGGMLLEQEEIDKERGIILEEKRMRQNAFMRTYAQYLPVLTNNSLYGKRIPIGKETVIQTAPRKVFIDYYRDWYRPDNMAVIVVGDIDIAAAESRIRLLFSDLVKPAAPMVRPAVVPVKWHTVNKAHIVSDPENTNSTISIYLNMEKDKPETNWGDYADDITNNIISSLFSNRLEEYALDSKSPVGYAGINLKNGFLRGYQLASVIAQVKDNPADAVHMLVGEILKAKQFGFSQAELDRVKKEMLKYYEEMLLEKDKTESARYVSEYVVHFLNKVPSPGIESEQPFVAAFLKTLSLKKVNDVLAKFDLNKPAFVLYNATEAMKNKLSVAELLAAYEAAKKQKVEAPKQEETKQELIDQLPAPGTVVSAEINQELGSTLLTLSNGIKVIYKKTDFKNDEILLKASQWGGATHLTLEEVTTSKYFSMVNSLGLGTHKAADMPKVLAGVGVNVFMNITPAQLSVFGSASAKDVEKCLQLLHLKLTRPNFDSEEFEGIKATFSTQVGGLLQNPSYRFSDTLNKFRTGNNPRFTGLPLSSEVQDLQLAQLKGLYEKFTANLSGMVIVFSGNIDEKTFPGLMEKYIASIPVRGAAVTLNRDNIVRSIKGKNTFLCKGGKENKSEINHTYYGDMELVSDMDNMAFGLLTEILQMRATEKLREEMGSTYSPRVSGAILRPPLGNYNLSLTVSSLPENAEKIVAAFDSLVWKVLNGDITPEQLQKAKAQRIKTFETMSKTNSYWTNVLEQQHLYGFDARNIAEYVTRVEAVTKDDIVTTAKKYLGNCNVLKGIMNPE